MAKCTKAGSISMDHITNDMSVSRVNEPCSRRTTGFLPAGKGLSVRFKENKAFVPGT